MFGIFEIGHVVTFSIFNVSRLLVIAVSSLQAKEAIGAVALLTHEDGRQMVANVEYNQLGPLLLATGDHSPTTITITITTTTQHTYGPL